MISSRVTINLYDMYIEKIEDINVHGGSIRVFIRNNTNIIIRDLTIINNNFVKTILDFKEKLFIWKNEFLNLYYNLKKNGNKIWGYGASGRSNIILSFLGIELDEIVDDAHSKIGSYMPISHKYINNSSFIYESPPEYIIILSWPYKYNIIQKHAKYLKNGGHFIIPLPNISII